MAIDKASLQAFQAYSKVDSKNFGSGIDAVPGDSIKFGSNSNARFSNVVDNVFNAYSKMSPEQILSHIRTRAVDNNFSSGNIISQAISAVKAPLKAAEIVTKKALLGEASILELATSTTQAQNTLKTVVAFRDQLTQGLDKIFSMQL
jgi:flagellar hook-basal body complex protein FliE